MFDVSYCNTRSTTDRKYSILAGHSTQNWLSSGYPLCDRIACIIILIDSTRDPLDLWRQNSNSPSAIRTDCTFQPCEHLVSKLPTLAVLMANFGHNPQYVCECESLCVCVYVYLLTIHQDKLRGAIKTAKVGSSMDTSGCGRNLPSELPRLAVCWSRDRMAEKCHQNC